MQCWKSEQNKKKTILLFFFHLLHTAKNISQRKIFLSFSINNIYAFTSVKIIKKFSKKLERTEEHIAKEENNWRNHYGTEQWTDKRHKKKIVQKYQEKNQYYCLKRCNFFYKNFPQSKKFVSSSKIKQLEKENFIRLYIPKISFQKAAVIMF